MDNLPDILQERPPPTSAPVDLVDGFSARQEVSGMLLVSASGGTDQTS